MTFGQTGIASRHQLLILNASLKGKEIQNVRFVTKCNSEEKYSFHV